jgi:hypothetical protein
MFSLKDFKTTTTSAIRFKNYINLTSIKRMNFYILESFKIILILILLIYCIVVNAVLFDNILVLKT